MIDWTEALVEDIARRRAVVFIGAGVSMNSKSSTGPDRRPPNWVQFLNRCVERDTGDTQHIVYLIESGDLLSACELLKMRLADTWPRILADEFSTPRYKPAEIHRQILLLDLRIVITQNFDKIYDVYAQSETAGSTRISHYYDSDTPEIMRGDYRGILKVHGTIDQPSKTVFTREDYANLRYQHRAFQALIDALFLTHTFLFIGCSTADPDLRLFLENHSIAHPSAPVHFMTSPDGEIHPELDTSARHNHNLRILRYDPADGHKELTESLADLVSRVGDQRDRLAETQTW